MKLMVDNHTFMGMRQDISISKLPNTYLLDALNIRITARNENTLFSITNERGPRLLEDVTVNGTYLGHCLLNLFIVVFSTKIETLGDPDSKIDYITRINLDPACQSSEVVKILYEGSKENRRGNLNFDENHKIEAICSYENEDILKVYWTDGYNQPRLINIVATDDKVDKYNYKSFDFVLDLELNEMVVVDKINGSGEFPSGVILYACTYYNKYMQESNIFYTTPLLYISYLDRGGSPEDKIACSFRISIANPDPLFEYVRIYSIMRTSINATPVVKLLLDIKILEPIEYESFEPNVVLNTPGNINLGTSLGSVSAINISFNFGVNWYNIIELLHTYTYDKSGFSYYDLNLCAGTHLLIRVGQSYYYYDLISKNVIISDYSKLYNLRITYCSNKNSEYYGRITFYVENNLLISGSTFFIPTCFMGNIYNTISYIDTGTNGAYIDPTELLYKGGEEIIAGTIELKDETLFLGDIKLKRPHLDVLKKLFDYTSGNPINSDIQNKLTLRKFYRVNDNYTTNTLSSPPNFPYMGASAFKLNEYYRLGLQFQYKNGKWSEPYWIGDKLWHINIGSEYTLPYSESLFLNRTSHVLLPEFYYLLPTSVIDEALANNYLKVRPVYVLPSLADRTILYQGVTCPTLYRNCDRDDSLYAQSSWIFRIGNHVRPSSWNDEWDEVGANGYPVYLSLLSYKNLTANTTSGCIPYHYAIAGLSNTMSELYNNTNFSECLKFIMAPYITCTEVMGNVSDNEAFRADDKFCTMHSPDVVFDDLISLLDFAGSTLYLVGRVEFLTTYGDIDLQTSSPPIGTESTGFLYNSELESEVKDNASISYVGELSTNINSAFIIKLSKVLAGNQSFVSGFFYNDFCVDDSHNGESIGAYRESGDDAVGKTVWWPIYMWHKNGSLNNDISRSGRSAELLKKIMSNYRKGGLTYYSATISDPITLNNTISLFNSDLLAIVKLGDKIYKGNIESMITPSSASPFYIYELPWGAGKQWGDKVINNTSLIFQLKIFGRGTSSVKLGLYMYSPYNNSYIYSALTLEDCPSNYPKWLWNDLISRDHSYGNDIGDYYKGLCLWNDGISIKYKSTPHLVLDCNTAPLVDKESSDLALVEVRRPYNSSTMFGGTSKDALMANLWIPCGPPVKLLKGGPVCVNFKWGDTYYQLFECLKTYPFTEEDKNLVVEIASFMCETRINIDGRYDRNRGQISGLYMRPTNFNLLNPVYSQQDNFFNYRMLDEDYYKLNSFPNLFTWTKEKSPGADVDLWTNLTLASTYNLDGSKGLIRSLNTWKDTIYCFLDKGISRIIFNSRVLIQSSDGIPIELTNSYKVDGYSYVADGVGCVNKLTIKETPSGIYFIDYVTNNLCILKTEGIGNVSNEHHMSIWFLKNEVTRNVYDDVNHDLYIVNDTEALCYSEVLSEFVSRMSYGGMLFIETYGNNIYTSHNNQLYLLNQGDYNKYFVKNSIAEFKPWFINFASNGTSGKDGDDTGLDKVFENIEYRMDVYGYVRYPSITLPIWTLKDEASFDYIHVKNEYLDTGEVELDYTQDRVSNLKKKFRVWRLNIPRNLNSRDRIRNTWCNIELGIKNTYNTDKAELHDLSVYYYI